ncbi:GIY-YIG nuclease family protein, partial [bacterium]|nr:GIY-YIG nuclease family protein [bacterium]
TDELGKRLARHGVEKPNWHELIAFVSPRITKTEVKYLENEKTLVYKMRGFYN